MPADLHAVHVIPQVVGVVDDPTGQPKNLALELAENGQIAFGD